LTRCRQVLGEDHPHTLLAAVVLGVMLCELGKDQQARHLAEDTLTRARRVPGEDHPDTLRLVTSLAFVLSELGEHEQSRQLKEWIKSQIS
jgi:hypothetical protein